MASGLLDLPISWTQLRPGTLVAEQRLFDLGNVAIGLRRFGVAFTGNGDIRNDTTFFGLLENPRGKARWSGVDVTRDDVATTRGRFDVSAEAPQAFYTITLQDGVLLKKYPAAAWSLNVIEKLPHEPALTRSRYARNLRAYLRWLFLYGVRPGRNSPRLIEGNLIPLLAAAIGEDGEHVEPSRPHGRRIKAVEECQAFIDERMGEPVTLMDLSEISGLRPRSLINAFEAVTGISPMAYLRAQRLGRVHEVLQTAQRAPMRIIDVAADWGFWHMGHFAAAYRAMFGESPSETLLRSTQRRSQ